MNKVSKLLRTSYLLIIYNNNNASTIFVLSTTRQPSVNNTFRSHVNARVVYATNARQLHLIGTIIYSRYRLFQHTLFTITCCCVIAELQKVLSPMCSWKCAFCDFDGRVQRASQSAWLDFGLLYLCHDM